MAAAGGKWNGGTFFAATAVNAKSSKDLKEARRTAGNKLASRMRAHGRATKNEEAARAEWEKTKKTHKGRKAAHENLKQAQSVTAKREKEMNRAHDQFSRINDTYHQDKANAKAAKAGKATRRNTRLNVLNTKSRKRG